MAAFLDIVIAIKHLETQNKVHRDISYTNILLRVREDSDRGAREKVMQEHGLSEIEELRKRLNCREGLLIDFDYGAALVGEETALGEAKKGEMQGEGESPQAPDVNVLRLASGRRTGTPPFIAMELLLYKVPHRVSHDLESLFYVLLFICTHLGGPHNTAGDPPLYGGVNRRKRPSKHPSGISQWLSATDLLALGNTKHGHMVAFFYSFILPFISPYFLPLKQHIISLRDKIIPPPAAERKGDFHVHSEVTCDDLIEVFKTALLDQSLITQAEQAGSNLGKRSLPGELVSNGWEPVKPGKRKLTSEPKISPSPTKSRTKLMKKGRPDDV